MELPNTDFDTVMDLLQENVLNNKDVVSDEFDIEIDDFDDIESFSENENDYMFDLSEDFYISENSKEEPSNSKQQKEDYLFNGSKVTISVAMVLILSYSIRFSLSSVALSNLLLLINMMLPVGSRLCKTLHYFRQHFESIKSPMLYHHFCNNCFSKLTVNVKDCEKCGHSFTDGENKACFIEFPIVSQLETLFSRSNFCENLQYRFYRPKSHSDHIEDIYDGCIYKELFEDNGLLSNPDNISFLWNTDGVPLFKSSKVSIWPIFLVINELEPKFRFKSENMIFAGMWYGTMKPEPSIFLEPLYRELKTLENGVTLKVRLNDNRYGLKLVRAFLIAGTFDLPARSLVAGTIQFNGKYGCIKCYQEGESYKTVKGGHVWTYPFNVLNPKGPLRVHEDLKKNALEAFKEKKTVNGVKRPTWLHGVRFFHLINGVAIDYMHGVMLGVVKLLLKLWFSTEFKMEKFNCCEKLTLFDQHLLKIKPPIEITRPPRSYQKYGSDWKASEYRNFLLFYGLPVMVDILPQNQLSNFSLLAHSVHILLQFSISKHSLDYAEKMLIRFCQDFQLIYGQRYMLSNIHQLVHLYDDVKHLGPLWSHSCFPFEDKNRFILQLIHGSQRIEFQLNSAANIIRAIPEVIEKNISTDPLLMRFYESMNKQKVLPFNHSLGNGNCILGKSYKVNMTDNLFGLVAKLFNVSPVSHEIFKFDRITLSNEIIHAQSYQRVTRRDSSVISYIDRSSIKYGCVKQFYMYKETNKTYYFALVEEFNVIHKRDNSYIIIVSCESSKEDKLVKIGDICHKMVYIDYNKAKPKYLCYMPNHFESC